MGCGQSTKRNQIIQEPNSSNNASNLPIIRDETGVHLQDSSGLLFREANNANSTLLTAAKRGDLKEVERLLNSEKCDVNEKGMWNSTPLITAIQYGYDEIALTLMKQEGIDVKHRNEKGATALLYACMDGKSLLVEKLLSLGADVECPVVMSIYNQLLDRNIACTPLSSACICGDVDTVALLFRSGCSVNQIFEFSLTKSVSPSESHQPTGLTPLGAACAYGRVPLCDYLLSSKADTNIADSELLTPLHHAVRARSNQIELISTFARYSKLSEEFVNKADKLGNSALHYAVDSKLLEVTKELLQHGASTSLVNGDGQTCLHIAVKRRCEELVRCLLERHSDPLLEDAKGQSSVSLAAKYCKDSEVFTLLEDAATSWRARRSVLEAAESSSVGDSLIQRVARESSGINQNQDEPVLGVAGVSEQIVQLATKNLAAGEDSPKKETETAKASWVPKRPSVANVNVAGGPRSNRSLVATKAASFQAASPTQASPPRSDNSNANRTSGPRRASSQVTSNRFGGQSSFVTPDKKRKQSKLNPAVEKIVEMATPSAVQTDLVSPTPLQLQDLCE